MHKMIVIYLLIGIDLHGGTALATSNMGHGRAVHIPVRYGDGSR